MCSFEIPPFHETKATWLPQLNRNGVIPSRHIDRMRNEVGHHPTCRESACIVDKDQRYLLSKRKIYQIYLAVCKSSRNVGREVNETSTAIYKAREQQYRITVVHRMSNS